MNKGEKTLREIVYEEILKIMVEKGYNFQQELTKEEEKKVKEKASFGFYLE
jgi:hypothetical protein